MIAGDAQQRRLRDIECNSVGPLPDRQATQGLAAGRFAAMQGADSADPTTAGVATPSGWKIALFSAVGQPMVAARIFESLPTIRATYNRTTKRIQWELDFSRMPLHEQSEGVVTSLS